MILISGVASLICAFRFRFAARQGGRGPLTLSGDGDSMDDASSDARCWSEGEGSAGAGPTSGVVAGSSDIGGAEFSSENERLDRHQ